MTGTCCCARTNSSTASEGNNRPCARHTFAGARLVDQSLFPSLKGAEQSIDFLIHLRLGLRVHAGGDFREEAGAVTGAERQRAARTATAAMPGASPVMAADAAS